VCRVKLVRETLLSLENSPPNVRAILHAITPSGMHRIQRRTMASLPEALRCSTILGKFSGVAAVS
jgi:hypothetical protein